MTYHHLCIGGPYDGEHYDSDNPEYFRAAIRPPMPILEEMDKISSIPDFEVVAYKREYIRFGDDQISFWIPEDMTALQAIKKLMSNYKPKRKQK